MYLRTLREIEVSTLEFAFPSNDTCRSLNCICGQFEVNRHSIMSFAPGNCQILAKKYVARRNADLKYVRRAHTPDVK